MLRSLLWLSHQVFNYAIDWITSNSLANFSGVTVSHDLCIPDLYYADNIAILGESFDDIQTVINQMQIFASKIGIRSTRQRQNYEWLDSPQTIHNQFSSIENHEWLDLISTAV